jgi:hypothetical protein
MMKMNKTYTLYPKIIPTLAKLRIPKEIQVIFVSGKVKLERRKPYQTVTTCTFRDHLTIIGVGSTVENPNDNRDDEEGRRVAFKRAVQSMANKSNYKKKWYLNKKMRKDLDKLFRCAYRNARRK